MGQGFYAQGLWVEAINSLGYNILVQNTNEFRKVKATTPGDIDIIIEKDGDFFGVEIKNGLSYPNDIKNKFCIAVELGLFPIIIARNFSFNDRIWINTNGGIFKIYQTAIFNPSFKSTFNGGLELLGYPVIFLEHIDDNVKNHLEKIIHNAIIIKEEYQSRQEHFKSLL